MTKPRMLIEAAIAQLQADDVLADSTFEGETENTGLERYAVVFANLGTREQARFSGPSTLRVITLTVHSVGTTPDQARRIAERVDEQLTDVVLSVTGWSCRMITHPVSIPTQRDDDGPERLFYNVDEFELIAERI